MKKIKTEINHQDARGMIIDLISNVDVNAITLISFTAGAVRGNHFHKKTTQWNYVTKGRIKLVSQTGSGLVEELILKSGDLVETAPMEKHALIGLEDSEALIFTQGPRGGKEYESDTFRLEQPLVAR